MLADGFVLGMVTLAGFVLLFKKLPKKVQVFTYKHPVFTEVIMVIFFYSIMGFTLIAHVSAAFMTLGGMILLYIASKPEDFVFIYDSIDRIKAAVNRGLLYLKEVNENYKAKQKIQIVS